MEILHLNKDNFNETIKNNKTILIDFWAPWCQPCRMLGPVMEQIALEHDDVLVAKVNCDEEEELCAQFRISSIPAVFVIKDGKVVNSSIGFRPKAEIENLLK